MVKKFKKQLRNHDLIKRAKNVLPAGGFGNFDPSIFIERGDGSYVFDSEGNKFIDLLIGSGPMIIGHGHPEVIEKIKEQVSKGLTFFTNNSSGLELAEEICNAVSCAEQVRYVSTGAEADMYAIRLARAYTSRTKIIKFEGGYHGMCAEAQMSLAPNKLINFPQALPDSAGIPKSVENEILIAPFNDIEFIENLLLEYGDEVAGIIVEPFQRIIPPRKGFLEGLRKLADKYQIMLIFDEIVTGFRFKYGGAQELYSVKPDICTLGKIIGGGFPLAAVVASKDIMSCFDLEIVGKEKWLMQLGTLSGNPIACVAGLKTLEILRRNGVYEKLYEIGLKIMNIIKEELRFQGIEHQIVGHETLFDVVFNKKTIKNYRDIFESDEQRSKKFNDILRYEGILKSPAKIYPSLAITKKDLEKISDAVKKASRVIL